MYFWRENSNIFFSTICFLEQCVAKIVYENGGNQGLHSFPMTLFKQDSWAGWRARACARLSSLCTQTLPKKLPGKIFSQKVKKSAAASRVQARQKAVHLLVKMMTTMEKQPPSEFGPGSVHSGYSGPPPPNHQTIVTMTTDPNTANPTSVTEINLNIGYFKTLPGIIKVVQLVSSERNERSECCYCNQKVPTVVEYNPKLVKSRLFHTSIIDCVCLSLYVSLKPFDL